MENQSPVPAPAVATVEWTSTKAYSLSAISLVLGIVLGALFHGPAQPSAASMASIAVQQQVPPNAAQMPPSGMPQAMPPEDTVDPVFEKVKGDPKNFDLLSHAGAAALRAGNPKLAVDYYGRALQVKEDNELRINLGNARFRAGDADQSLKEFATVLKADPKNDKALYNMGVVRLVAKKDAKGAIASCATLLKFHPDHPHKAQVLELIERAKKAEQKS